MSKLLNNLQKEYDKLYYSQDTPNASNLQKCLKETHEFKNQLKKLKAHLNKNIQDQEHLISPQANEKAGTPTSDEKISKKRTLIQDKLNKTVKSWNHSIKKQSKFTHQQYGKFNKNALNQLKNFDLDEIYKNKISKDKIQFIDEAIGFHIARYNIESLPVEYDGKDGESNILSYLQNVYGIDNSTTYIFLKMGQIVYDLNHYKCDSCLEWINTIEHSGDSSNCTVNCDLKFELYILNGLNMIKNNESSFDVCKYFYKNIPQEIMISQETIKSSYTQTVTQITLKLMLEQTIEGLDAIIEERLRSCINIFTKEYCLHNRLSIDSPLFLIVLSGIISFQYFIKYNQIRALSHVGWTTENELPFDVDLPDFLSHFHPVFICPVLKEETTKENPPYSLACHHIISKKALDKLSKNGSLSFKCPYCPVHTTIIKTKRVNFVML
ncbi:E3 ubiquitin-protein ligase Rmd5p [Monosporozyma unispora]|nr:hypothetical protein C6P44_002324 [Kazachstania unispora]